MSLSPSLTPDKPPLLAGEGAPDELPEPGRDEADLTVDYLLRRMRFKSDFPALSASMARVQALAQSDTDSMQALSDEVLKDVALTQKLLRVVNTAHYRRAGTDPISTVSRAVAMIGAGGVRNMALSLMLLDRMQDKACPATAYRIPAHRHGRHAGQRTQRQQQGGRASLPGRHVPQPGPAAGVFLPA
jgi:hypothetical protein